jgi:maltose alpha-D-glucosyltransferase / alpha-amylase
MDGSRIQRFRSINVGERLWYWEEHMSDLWFKTAILYCVDVDAYMDGNGDGEGDFVGLTSRLDYIAGIGVTCIWLLPFYPTPNRDNGYDIADYYGVDPRVGTLGDFVCFLREAHDRGIKVIIDLVINHTSDQHPWFQQARSDRNSPYRDYYVWREDQPGDTSDEVIFPGHEKSIWSYDETARAWFLHRFFHHQPDLNIANPAVRREIRKVMGFWLQLGVAGFRVDAAPYLVEQRTPDDDEVTDEYRYLEEIRTFLGWRNGQAVLIAEANVEPRKLDPFLHEGRRMHMVFSFLVNKHLALALAEENAEPLHRVWKALPPIPESTQWAHFIRNLDELNLTHLLESEKQQVFDVFAPDEEMRIFGRGIRRRFPPMVKGDRRRMELAYSVMMTLPGTPVLTYGEEIGMGDDLSLPGRISVRTPMQWANEYNADFSAASEEKLYRPIVGSGPFSYKKVNVQDQQRDQSSFLNWMTRAIRVRKGCPELGRGTWEVITTNHAREVFAHLCELDGGAVLVLHNFSRESLDLEFSLARRPADHLVDLFSGRHLKSTKKGVYRLEVAPYGYHWLRLHKKNKPDVPKVMG